jgi:hypothetical protein
MDTKVDGLKNSDGLGRLLGSDRVWLVSTEGYDYIRYAIAIPRSYR